MRKTTCFMYLLGLMTLGWMATQAQGQVKVVATYSILGDFVENVGGDLVDLTVLVGANGDAHDYEPTPQDSVAIANAALVFENGLAFESWLEDLYRASGSEATRVVVSEGIIPRPMTAFGGHADEHAHEHEGEHGSDEEHSEEEHTEEHADHEHGEFDPHVWHNPQLVMTIIDNIATALANTDPTNQAVYTANAEGYKDELKQLDSDIQAEVDKLPIDKRKLVTSHDALAYFAYRYGFEVIGAVIPSVTTESSDASAGELAALVEDIKASGINAIFVENMAGTRLIEQVANAAGVTVAPGIYTDALGEEGSEGATYMGMMRYNARTIVEALSQ